MLGGYSLGSHFDTFVQGQLSTGRYRDTSEVLCDALRLMEEREQRLHALDTSLARSRSDMQAGRYKSAGEVCDRLEKKYTKMAEEGGV